MNDQAFHAIRAAEHRRVWGRYATFQYLMKRGVPTSLYVLARTLYVTREL